MRLPLDSLTTLSSYDGKQGVRPTFTHDAFCVIPVYRKLYCSCGRSRGCSTFRCPASTLNTQTIDEKQTHFEGLFLIAR